MAGRQYDRSRSRDGTGGGVSHGREPTGGCTGNAIGIGLSRPPPRFLSLVKGDPVALPRLKGINCPDAPFKKKRQREKFMPGTRR